MLGHPEAPVPQRLGLAGQIEGVAEGEAGVAAFDDRGQVEDGEGNHRGHMGALGAQVTASEDSLTLGGSRSYVRGLCTPVAIVAQLVRASVCGTEGRGFKSRRSPHFLRFLTHRTPDAVTVGVCRLRRS